MRERTQAICVVFDRAFNGAAIGPVDDNEVEFKRVVVDNSEFRKT